jgi:hypothetical protein
MTEFIVSFICYFLIAYFIFKCGLFILDKLIEKDWEKTRRKHNL